MFHDCIAKISAQRLERFHLFIDTFLHAMTYIVILGHAMHENQRAENCCVFTKGRQREIENFKLATQNLSGYTLYGILFHI